MILFHVFSKIDFGGEDAIADAAPGFERFVVVDGVALQVIDGGVDLIAVGTRHRSLLVSGRIGRTAL